MQGGSGASGLASAYADRALYRIAFLPSALEAASRKISLAELDSFAKAAMVPAEIPSFVEHSPAVFVERGAPLLDVLKVALANQCSCECDAEQAHDQNRFQNNQHS